MAAEPLEKGGYPSTMLVAGTTPLETRMLFEKPAQAHPAPGNAASLLPSPGPSLQLHQDGAASLKLTSNLDMRISVLYNRDPAPIEPQKRGDTSLLMKYSLGYRLLPNLQVGLNGYLFRPDSDNLSLSRQYSSRVMGLGPGLQYDLGRWSFLLKSQMETGTSSRERPEGLQSSVQVWYAF